ncbi:MAG: ribosome silencing factor [Syntrophobacterales bacterium]|nr:ribosome silencing factor [Syntrophobacterales bacterium]OPX40822.1 MAG: ribosome silencing factor [Desulfobacteraceae bacterium 4484_190.3]
MNQPETRNTVLRCINAALGKKAKNLTILKVKELSSFADYFIICSGTSDRQVKAIAGFIEETLKKSGILPLGIEGKNSGNWILMDYGDVIIHIFYEPTREFYDIERLWSDAPSMIIEESVEKITSLDNGM